MSFLHPWFLGALLFLAVPILVHLFNFRKYQKIYFSNTRLLKSLIEDTKKSAELKKKLILISRILALIFLVLAFSQPYWGSKSSNSVDSDKVISIYIDNSMSMDAVEGSTTKLEKAKKLAIEILSNSKQSANYQIISNDFTAQQLQVLSYNEALKEIEKIHLSSSTKTIDKIFFKQEKILDSKENSTKFIYWISDFQAYQATNIYNSSKINIQAIPLNHISTNNDFIDSAWLNVELLKVHQEVSLICRSKRFSKNDLSSSNLDFNLNENLKGSREFVWKEELERTDTFRFKIMKEGWNRIKINLASSQMTFDNTYYMSFFVQPKPVVSILGTGEDVIYLNAAFKADNNFDIQLNTLSSNKESNSSNLLILNHLKKFEKSNILTINEFLKLGKHVTFFINSNADIANYNAAFKEFGLNIIQQKNSENVKIQQLNTQDVLLQNILSTWNSNSNFPYSKTYFSLAGNSNRGKQVLISYNNGQPFLVKYTRSGEGNIYLFSSSIDALNSNFVTSSLFAPLMFKLGNIVNSTINYSYFISQNQAITIPLKPSNTEKVFHLIAPNFESIPSQRQIGNILNIYLEQDVKRDGIYILGENKLDSAYFLALNYSRKESVLNYLSDAQIKDKYVSEHVTITPTNQIITKQKEHTEGNNLWKYLLIVTLLFLFIEMALIMFFDNWLAKKRN